METERNIFLKPGIYNIKRPEIDITYSTYFLAEPNYDGILEIAKHTASDKFYDFVFSPKIKSGRDVRLNNILFLNDNLGWIVGMDGILLTTTDGGTTWESKQIQVTNSPNWLINPQTNAFLGLHDIFFTDSISGWVIGDNGLILRTTNGGMNWEGTAKGTFTDPYKKVYFINKQEGFIIKSAGNTSASIQYTNNSGNTWNILAKPGHYYVFNKNIWKVTAKETLISKDLCKTWKPFLNNVVYSLIFVDSLNGWHITGAGLNTWDLHREDRQVNIANTKDGGKTWINQKINGTPYELFFVNENFGWALCGSDFYNSISEGLGLCDRKIFYTINGGNNWEEIIKPNGFKVPFSTKMFFLDKDKGFIIDKTFGNIYSTVDGGKNWSSFNILDLGEKF